MPELPSIMSSLSAPMQPTAPPAPLTMRDFGDHQTARETIFSRALQAARNLKPVANSRYQLGVENIEYEDPDEYPLSRQKDAILKGNTVYRRLRGDWVLRDPAGQELERKRQTIAQIPWLTNQGAFIISGRKYGLGNQLRLRPGMFARVKDNGETEIHSNHLPGKGISHRYSLEPDTGVFKMQFAQSNLPLISVLKMLGKTDTELRNQWGNELYEANAKKDDPRVVDRLYTRLIRKGNPDASDSDKSAAVKAALEKMEFDPEINKRHLGAPYRNLTADTMLAAAKKMLAVSRGEADPDDRDHPANQILMGPEDLIAERLERPGSIMHQLLWKASTNGDLKRIPVGAFDRHVKSAILDSGVGQYLTEVNPLEVMDQSFKITRMGVGAMQSMDAVPQEARSIQNGQIGYIDPVFSPESFRAGVDARVAYAARKGSDNRMYAPYTDPRTGEIVYKSPQDVADMTLAFPGEPKNDRFIKGMQKGRLRYVDRNKVDLVMPHPEQWFGSTSNLIFAKNASKGQRDSMGARFIIQALPLQNAEAPLVRTQVVGRPGLSFEELYGRQAGAVFADQAGRVVSITPDGIKVRYQDGTTKTHDLFNHIPNNQKTDTHNDPVVQPGDMVQPGQLLAKSNFTDDKGHLAAGLNARVAFLPFRGLNHLDAWVISKSFADRLTSQHLYQHTLDLDEKTKLGKKQFVAMFAAKFPRKTLDTIDDSGVVRPGTVVHNGDPLILAASEKPATHKSVHAGHRGSFADQSVLWDHHDEGVVTDVARTPRGIVVAVKSLQHMKIGDKLAGRHGNKGVVASIVPDEEMPHDQEGRPFEVLANPTGIISRVNASQKAELWLGKIAAKTGKPYVLEDFADHDLMDFVEKELQKHNMSGMEEIVDPTTGRPVNVATGMQHMMKLHHQAECFDAQTEVLSERGWLPWPDVTDNDLLAGVDNSGHLIFEKPNSITREMYRGDMYCFFGQYIEYCITGNHNLYAQFYYGNRGFHLVPAAQAHGRRFRVKQFDVLQHNSCLDIDAELCDCEVDGADNPEAFKIKDYTGMVYCADMPNGLLYTRRNGKPMLSGNSKHHGRGIGGYTAEDTPARGGTEGCFIGSQAIRTAYGVERISRICEKRLGVNVLTYSAAFGWVYRPVTDWFIRRAKITDLVNVKLADGTAIKATKNHIVFTPDGAREIGTLQSGDYMLTPGPIATAHQMQILYGSMLGDSFTTDVAFGCEHSIKQVEYVDWKQSTLAGLEATFCDRNMRKKPNKIRGQLVNSAKSRVVNIFHRHIYEKLSEECYTGPAGEKTITDNWLQHLTGLSVAVWTLDDGWIGNISKKTGKVKLAGNLATCGFSADSVAKLASWLTARYAEPCWPSKTGVLALSAGLCRKIVAEIAAWVPWNAIPKSKKWLRSAVAEMQTALPPQPIMSVCSLGLVPLRVKEVLPYKHDKPDVEEINVYDITVAETHSYCAGSALVSNSKRVAMMDVSSLLSSGATEVLRDARLIKGQKNPQYWATYMAGYKPATPAVPLVYRKFHEQLRGAGINVSREGSKLHLFALTNRDIEKLAENRELQSVDTVHWRDDMRPIEGGLFSPDLTGGHGGSKWSQFSLVEPMPSPVFEDPIRHMLGLTGKQFEAILFGKEKLDGKTGPQAIHDALAAINVKQAIQTARADIQGARKGKRDEAIRRLGYLKALEKQGIEPKDWMLNKVPVLPPLFRPVSQMQTGQQLVSDANLLYKEVWDANQNLKAIRDRVQDVSEERQTLYHAFKSLVGLGDPVQPKNREKGVSGFLAGIFGSSPKFSMLQQKLLGTPVDLVGRAVIIPNPDLSIDEAGIPEARAWEVYSPFLVRRLVRQGVGRLQALEAVEKRDQLARKALLAEMDARPIIINRAPVLHRYGRMAFFPRLVKGDTLHVSPLITKGMGADFDGDQQIGQVIVAVDKSNSILYSNELVKSFFEERNMTARFMTVGLYREGFNYYCINLEDFPRGDITHTDGRVDFHAVPPGLHVVAYDEKSRQQTLAEVSHWSIHRGCEIEIVNLRSKRQILSDNDPRAVYGLDPTTYEFVRRCPRESIGLFVPRADHLDGRLIGGLEDIAGSPDARRVMGKIKLTRRLGRLIGQLAGNGWVSKSTGSLQVHLAATDPAVQARYRECLTELFVDPPTVTTARREAGDPAGLGESMRLTVSSQEYGQLIVDWINAGPGHTARDKRLPAFVCCGPEEFRLGLVEGLFDSDGTISISHSKSKPQLMVSYSSSSLRLIYEIQQLLRTLGCASRVTPSKTPAGEPFWYLVPSAVEFYDLKPEIANTARRTALESAARPDSESGSYIRTDVVPFPKSCRRLAMDLLKTKELKHIEAAKNMYSTVSTTNRSNSMSRLSAVRLIGMIGAIDHADWQKFVAIVQDRATRWDCVESYESTGIVEDGYDLTVPGFETFMTTDGLILSNTSNYEVPASDEAAQEALYKMLPSRNLVAVADFKKPVPIPQEDYVGGIFSATHLANKDRRPRVFATKHDALKAWWRGELHPGDPVEIIKES